MATVVRGGVGAVRKRSRGMGLADDDEDEATRQLRVR